MSEDKNIQSLTSLRILYNKQDGKSIIIKIEIPVDEASNIKLIEDFKEREKGELIDISNLDNLMKSLNENNITFEELINTLPEEHKKNFNSLKRTVRLRELIDSIKIKITI